MSRKSVSPSLKLLDHLGLIEIEPGLRLVNVFRLSRRWCTIDEVEAKQLAELAREVKPHRTFEKRREAKPAPLSKLLPEEAVSTPKSATIERPRIMQRRVPSLPMMPWQNDGR